SGNENGDKNSKNAFEWYQKAALQWHAKAQEVMGDCYLSYGTPFYSYRVVVANDKQANDWYQKSAESGNASAQYKLARRYYDSYGLEKNIPQARYWFEKAARFNNEARA